MKVLVNCKNCNLEFNKSQSEIKRHPESNHFCSRQCSGSFNTRGKNHNAAIERVCKECKASFKCKSGHRSTTFCKDCLQNYFTYFEAKAAATKLLTLKELQSNPSVKDKHPSWKNSHVRNLNRSWNKDLLGFPCQKCNYALHIELAHIKGVASFDLDAKLGEVNHPNNILVLCPNCHWEFDSGLLKLEQVPQRALSS